MGIPLLLPLVLFFSMADTHFQDKGPLQNTILTLNGHSTALMFSGLPQHRQNLNVLPPPLLFRHKSKSQASCNWWSATSSSSARPFSRSHGCFQAHLALCSGGWDVRQVTRASLQRLLDVLVHAWYRDVSKHLPHTHISVSDTHTPLSMITRICQWHTHLCQW